MSNVSTAIVSSDSLGGTATLLVGHRCTLGWVNAINTTGSAAYTQLFDAATAGAVTLGTTVPTLVVSSAASGAGFQSSIDAVFTNGVVAASTTTTTGLTAATQHVRIGVY